MNCRDQEEVARSRKFALNRETLRTTGTGKPVIIFRQREFATIASPPPLSNGFKQQRWWPPVFVFLGRAESIGPMWFQPKTKSRGREQPPPAQAEERVGRT